jgi:hypothetical protein
MPDQMMLGVLVLEFVSLLSIVACVIATLVVVQLRKLANGLKQVMDASQKSGKMPTGD